MEKGVGYLYLLFEKAFCWQFQKLRGRSPRGPGDPLPWSRTHWSRSWACPSNGPSCKAGTGSPRPLWRWRLRPETFSRQAVIRGLPKSSWSVTVKGSKDVQKETEHPSFEICSKAMIRRTKRGQRLSHSGRAHASWTEVMGLNPMCMLGFLRHISVSTLFH